MRDDFYKWIVPNLKDTELQEDCLRYIAARAEKKKSKVDLQTICAAVNEYLATIDIEQVENPIRERREHQSEREFIDEILKWATVNLDDKKDIVWMKFTIDGYLGVVAATDDMNFSYTNTSGKIIRSLGKNWDENLLMVFPLVKSPWNRNILNRHLIESGIGNYLIFKNIPILDFYSHNI